MKADEVYDGSGRLQPRYVYTEETPEADSETLETEAETETETDSCQRRS